MEGAVSLKAVFRTIARNDQLVGMSATAFLMIFYPAISRRLHRKKLLGIMAVLAVSGYGLMLVSLPVPGNGMGKFGLLTVEQKLAEISGIIFGTTGGKYGGVQAGQSTGLLITMTVAPCFPTIYIRRNISWMKKSTTGSAGIWGKFEAGRRCLHAETNAGRKWLRYGEKGERILADL